jgi:Mlc titration factor MtfA (ptsG expression regulator)
MILTWLKQRRRRKLLATPFPAAWLEYLHKNVTHYAYLTATEQAKLRDDLRIFLAEKNWEGCGGLEITDEIKVTIAAQACLLVLAIEHHYYQSVKSILVYPTTYEVPFQQVLESGEVVEGKNPHLGEAWYRGPVVLAWDDVLRGGQDPQDGQNTVFHEFAHQLDFLDGSIDGTPPLESREQYQHWREVMTAEYNRLCRAAERGRKTLLDQYGATDEAEFFAVATECFFEKPVAMAAKHPQLYDLLRAYYHQDPAKRCADKSTQA